MSKKLSKYIAAFDYTDKILIVLSATTGSVSIASFATVVGTPLGIINASLNLVFCLTTEVVKKLLKTRNKKKIHNRILMLAKIESNSIKNLVSQALINLEISHEEFKTIVNEKDKHEEMKENIRNVKSNDEKDELSENSKDIRRNSKNV